MASVEADAIIRLVESVLSAQRWIPALRWALVTQARPLKIQFPGESELPYTPTALCAPALGSQVLTIGWSGRLVVIGQAGELIESVPLVLTAGTPYQNPTLYRWGRRVWIEGGWLMAADGANPAIAYSTSTVLANVPAGWRPSSIVVASASPFTTLAVTGVARVLTNGNIEVIANNNYTNATGGVSAVTGGAFPLTGLSWTI